MGVLKVKQPDGSWRKVGCGGSSGGANVYPTGSNEVILYTDGTAIWGYTNVLPSTTAYITLVNYTTLYLSLLSGTPTGQAIFYNPSVAGSGADLGDPTGTVRARTSANVYLGDVTAGASTIQSYSAPTPPGRLKLWDGSQWVVEKCDDAPGTELLTTNQRGFESGATTGWLPWPTYDTVLAITSEHMTGTYGLAPQHSTTSGIIPFSTPTGTSGFAVTPGTEYSFSFASRTWSGAGVDVRMYWYDSGGTFLSFSTGSSVYPIASTWTAYPAGSGGSTFTAPSSAAYGALYLAVTHIDVNGDRVYFDDFSLLEEVMGHPLKLWDGTTWQTVACMVPA